MSSDRPKRPLRRTGLISPFGVGAIVDYADGRSLMTASVDHWLDLKKPCPPELEIKEERLCKALRIAQIRLPPDFHSASIPATNFPKWHHCPKCGLMRNQQSATDCSSEKCKKTKTKTLPIRFVAVCSNGHIDDIDWMQWVHGKAGHQASCQLRYSAGRSASLAGITISCSCSKRRTLAGLFSTADGDGGLQQKCSGHRPWLGPKEVEGCNEMMRAAQKGASNVYFADTTSAIYVPNWVADQASTIAAIIDSADFWDVLETTMDEDNELNTSTIKRYAERKGVDSDSLLKAAEARHKGEVNEELEEQALKPAEYAAITSCAGAPEEELYVRRGDLTKYENWVSELFSGVYLIPKLRETRVLRGFTRVHPPSTSDRSRVQPVAREAKWLPGIKVTGEGFLLVFNFERLKAFCEHSISRARADRIAKNINSVNFQLGREQVDIRPEEILLHTFAHLMIRAISYECGYGSSALRERIYVDLDADNQMAGIMIYTASGDSEGTLGGIVRQAEPRNLERSIKYALTEGQWCSSDPVCSEAHGQGSDGANLAACHSCALLPETSCEYGNRMLDRVLVLGDTEGTCPGYFSQII
mgnify:CR=1 FL=1